MWMRPKGGAWLPLDARRCARVPPWAAYQKYAMTEEKRDGDDDDDDVG